jgi:hypothetical protein
MTEPMSPTASAKASYIGACYTSPCLTCCCGEDSHWGTRNLLALWHDQYGESLTHQSYQKELTWRMTLLQTIMPLKIMPLSSWWTMLPMEGRHAHLREGFAHCNQKRSLGLALKLIKDSIYGLLLCSQYWPLSMGRMSAEGMGTELTELHPLFIRDMIKAASHLSTLLSPVFNESCKDPFKFIFM